MCDHFALPIALGPFDRVWDRAALVAIPPERRRAYVAKGRELAPDAVVLLNVLHYDPSVMTGPPFAVSPEQVRSLFDGVEELGARELIDAEPRWRERGHQWFRSTTYRCRFPAP